MPISIFFLLILAPPLIANAANKTIEVNSDFCKLRVTFDDAKYSEEEVKNSFEIFMFGSQIHGPWLLTNDKPAKFLPVNWMEMSLAAEQKKLDALKGRKIPKRLESHRQRLVKDAEFELWKNAALISYAKDKNIDALKAPFKDFDHNKTCGVTLSLLKGVTKENTAKALAAMKKSCEAFSPENFDSAGCLENYHKNINSFAVPKEEPSYLVFVWHNCVNGLYPRFTDHKRALKEIEAKTEEFDCDQD